MRISNGIRKLEDLAIRSSKASAPKLGWIARKGAMTAIAIVVVPVTAAATGIVGVIDGAAFSAAKGIKAIKEV